jgi:hypothetical protein
MKKMTKMKKLKKMNRRGPDLGEMRVKVKGLQVGGVGAWENVGIRSLRHWYAVEYVV